MTRSSGNVPSLRFWLWWSASVTLFLVGTFAHGNQHLRQERRPPSSVHLASYPRTRNNAEPSSFSRSDFDWQAPEPYPELFDFDPNGNPPVPLSPDPLVSHTWSNSVNTSQLQFYRVRQAQTVERLITPDSAVLLIHEADDYNDKNEGASPILQVHDTVAIRWDWGVERAAWFEMIMVPTRENVTASHNIHIMDGWKVEMALSEFNSVYPGKRRVPILYHNNTYRLETNDEIYEGLRFTWVFLTKLQPSALPLAIIDVSIVAKIKPIDYRGSFASSCAQLTQIWYTGAYGVRLNIEATQFNSILIERGDREAIQGDGHPTMATALVAFGGGVGSGSAIYDLVLQQLWKTNSGHVHGHHVVDDGIMAYPMYWIGSVLDWYWATGDHNNFAALVPDVLSILDERVADFMDTNLDIGWMGWDDRLGNGWCYHYNNDNCTREGHLTFGALVVKVTKDVAHALSHLPGHEELADLYRQIQTKLIQRFQQLPEYPEGLGVHAAGNAITSEIASPTDIELWMNSTLNDIVTICSWSAFNQYWILQGLGAAEKIDHAIESVHTCWGSMLEMGKGCFYELGSPEWTKFRKDGDRLPTTPSMCHPWASGVSAWISSTLTGIKPITPGYSTFLAAPYVSPTYPTVNGTVPTPSGKICVEAAWKVIGEEASIMDIDLSSPENSKGLVGFRRNVNDCELKSVRIDGILVDTLQGLQMLAKDWTYSMEQNMLFVEQPDSSKREIHLSASYTCSQKQPTNSTGFPPAKYPGYVFMDRTSQGDGLLDHGSDGYILFGVDDGKNVEKLPSYISSVKIFNHGFSGTEYAKATFVGTSDSNKTYLPYRGSRSLGILGNDDDTYWNPGIVVDVSASPPSVGAVGGQGLMIDITAQLNRNQGRLARQGFEMDVNTSFVQLRYYKLSLYCVAQKNTEQFAIRVMDLSTLNAIAPTRMVEKHQDGLWWTVEYHSSVRLRIMSMYGMHISALAFSSSESVSSNVAAVEF